MHAAHGIADDEAQMWNFQALADEAVVRLHVIIIAELGKFRLQAIRRF